MIKDFYKYKKTIILLVVIIILLIFIKKGGVRKTIEKFENTEPGESLFESALNSFDLVGQTINDIFTKVDATSVTTTKDLTAKTISATAHLKVANHAYISGVINCKGNYVSDHIRVNNVRLDSTLLKKLTSLTAMCGYAVDGEGSTHLLFEGKHLLYDNNTFDAWSNNKWDKVYLFKGWAATFYKDGNYTGDKWAYENKTDSVKAFKPTGNVISSYTANWVGY